MASSHAEDFLEAVARNDAEKVKHLVEVEHVPLTTVNERLETAAHIAVGKSHLNLLKYLLSRDRYLLQAEDILGNNVLHIAVEKGNLFLIEYLVEEQGADIFAPIESRLGNTAVHLAAQAGHLAILQYFVEKRFANFNLRNQIGESLLFLAAEKQHLHVVKYLVERWNADVNMVDGNQQNILFVSAKVGDLRVPQYLLDERNVTSLDVNKRDLAGRTIIFYAAMFGYLDFIKYFVEEKNANFTIPNLNKRTPLHQAAASEQVKVVMYLVDQGADAETQDSEGKTPLDLAYDEKVAWYLKRATHQRLVRSAVPDTFVRPQMIRDNDWFPPNERIENRFELLGSRPGERIADRTAFSLTGILFSYALGTRWRRTKYRHSLFTPQETVQARVDPVAVAVVHANATSKFEEPLFVVN
jgi:ankyrin repeat protein